MKIFILLLLITLSIADLTEENASTSKSAAVPTVLTTTVKTYKESNDIGVKHLSSLTHHRKRYPLPPVAMQGIMKKYDPMATKMRGGKRMLLSELRLFKDQYLPLERSLNRIRRSPSHPQSTLEMPSLIDRKNQRDLRRLRRDLGFKNDLDINSYQYPPQMSQNSVYGQREHRPTAIRGMELDRLLQGLDFLEQLALMSQESEILPSASSVGQQRRFLHAPPSRFAPQPKLFIDDALDHRFSRVENQLDKLEEQPENFMWIPEKRWSKSRSSLSMIPGFKKRSVFREAALQQMVNQRAKRQKSFSSMAASLGAEVDPNLNMVHRTAM